MKVKSSFRRGWVAALGGALLVASVAVGAETASAAPILTVAILGPTTSAQLINRVNGGATGITVQADVGTTPPTVLYPYSPGATFEIKLTGVGKYNAGNAAATPPVAPFLEDLTTAEAAKVQATWCANKIDAVTGPPAVAARAVVGSDINTAAGAAANCKAFTSFTVTGSHSASTAGKVDTLTISGTLDGLPAGTQCTTSAAAGFPLALPCMLVVSDVALGGSALSLALPISNLTTISVAGPMNLATFTGPVARCVSVSPEPSVGCSSGRPTQVMAWGGAGFAPTDNNLNVAAYTAAGGALQAAAAAATAAGAAATAAATAYNDCVTANGGVGVGESSCTTEAGAASTAAAAATTAAAAAGAALATFQGFAGQNTGGVAAGSLALCTDSANPATCDNTKVALVPGQPGYAAGNATGGLAGAFVVATATPGNYHLRATYTRVTATGNPASSTTVVTQTQMTPFTVLGSPAATLDPAAGGATFGGTAVATLNVSGLEQNQPVTVTVKDVNGVVLETFTAKSDGYGRVKVENIKTDFPMQDVFVSSATANIGLTALPNTFKAAITRDVTICADAATCATGVILTVDVTPGNLAMFIETNELALAPIDLATIDLADPTTWYPTGAPAVTELIQIGDFTGSNAGFVVTGAVTDLRGSTLASNIIPKEDVWWSGVACDASATAGSGNDPLGVVTAGADSAPPTDGTNGEDTPSPLADGTAEICTLAPDATTARAGGVFDLTLELFAAARPITAADSYTGMLVLTVLGN